MAAAKVVTIGQQKGGAGKTTLAAQLAVAWRDQGARVVLLDVDPQGSLTAWYEARKGAGAERQDGLVVHAVQGWRLATELDRVRRQCDLVLVDTPPHAETDARVAVRTADLVLVPVQPSPMDLWATQATLDAAKKESTPVMMVFNRTPTRGKLVEAVRRKIIEMDVPVAQTVLGNRVAFAASMMEGKGVMESHARHTAAKEIRALAEEISAHIGLGG